MGEVVSIATLNIDESGVVRGMKRTTESVSEMDKELGRVAPAFEHHMFSMRAAAGALLGTFSVAGGILAFKGFLDSMVEATENFPKFTSAVDSAKNAVVAFYASLLNVNQTVGDFTKLSNVVTHLFEAGKSAIGGPLGVMWEFLWGQTAVGAILNMLHDAVALLDKLAPSLTATPEGPPPEQLAGGAGLQGFGVGSFIDMITKQLTTAIQYFNIFRVEGTETFKATGEAATFFEEKVVDLDASLDDIVRPSRWQRFKSEVADAFREVAKQLTTVNLMVDLIKGAVDQFANEIAQGFSGAGMTFRKFIADMLMYVGRLLVAWGALALVAAYFGYGPGYKAAAIAFAAGVAAMAASRAIGGGSQSSSDSGGGGYAGAAAAPPSSPSYEITIYQQGTVVSPADWTRSIIIDIKKALADGAGGGGF